MNEPIWKISRHRGRCAACNRMFAQGEEHRAAIYEAAPDVPGDRAQENGSEGEPGSAYQRVDFCEACWSVADKASWLAYWRTAWEPPPSDRRVFHRQTAVDVFRRTGLSEALPTDGDEVPPATPADPLQVEQRTRLRYVLALMLMRKKALKFVASRDTDGREWLTLRDGDDTEHVVEVPPITPDDADALSEEIARVMGW